MVAGGGAVGLGLRLHWVVDENEVRPAPGDGAADAGSEVFGVGGGREVVGSAAAGVEAVAKTGRVLVDEGADAAAEMMSEGGGVGRRDDGGTGILREPPWRKKH